MMGIILAVAVGAISCVIGGSTLKAIRKLYKDIRHDQVVLTRFLRDEIRKISSPVPK